MKILYISVLLTVSITVAASDLSTKAHDVFEMIGLHGRTKDRSFSRAIKKIRGYDDFVPQAYRFRRPVSDLNLKASDENFRRLALDMSNSNEFVLVMSMKNENRKRGTLLAVKPKDEFSGSEDYLEIVCDPSKDHLSIFASIDGDEMAYTFETAGVKVGLQDPVWTNLTLHFSMEAVTLFHGCHYVGQFTLQTSIFQVFDDSQKVLLLATGYRKGQRDYRGSLERIRFYVGASLSEILKQEEGCSDGDLASASNGASITRQTSEARAATVSSAFPPSNNNNNNNNVMCGMSCSVWTDFYLQNREQPLIGKPAETITFPDTESKTQSCWDQSHRYAHDEQWSRDECQRCNCSNGRVTCVVAECPPLHCIDVIKMDGECCAVCSETADPYSEWSDWTPCSVTCGLGQQQRGRACDGVHFNCTLTTKESRTCARPPCDVKVKRDGRWSPWAPWNGCSVTCGEGHSTRVRLCNAPSPQLGGKECFGESREVRTCFEPHCPIDGEWGPYSAFTPCTASCGNGTKTRNRQCDNPAPQYGGKPCVGESTETVHCFERPCPIDGRWSLWSKYGPCSATCGKGQKTRNRECNNPEPKYGGRQCEGPRSEVRDCGGPECPIDGKWGPYTPFSRCSVTCGQGFKKRSRECNNPAPQHGGKQCAGDSTLVESCIEKQCPINTCLKYPCYRGVTCTPYNDGTFVCGSCPDGMQGDGTKCTDIDECTLVPDTCFHYEDKHRCQNQQGGYTCLSCPEGYKGTRPSGVGVEYATEHKQRCKVSNPCTDGSNPCPGNSECIFLDSTISPPFMCKCLPGYSACPSCKGLVCSEDTDLDGWPDHEETCDTENGTITCHKDNCPTLPNSGQENADGDEEGDACDLDDDNDRINDGRDNCRLIYNPSQHDSDNDRVGDVCDNCPFFRNPGQIDTDGDGLGDKCDPDIDGDDIKNDNDNCKYVSNKDQKDTDSDGIGDACDNCPKVGNRDQSDIDDDLVGDACDTDRDRDMDGWQDSLDNCPFTANSAQTDHDHDGIGDSCDPDDDNDNILDEIDYCRLVFNPDQLDTDGNGRGDVCEHDFDGDGIPDFEDVCYGNAKIQKTDFSFFDRVKLDPSGTAQIDPNWAIRHKGKEIIQTINCDPGLAISRETFEGVDFDGTFFVNTGNDDDYAGFVFGYQSSSRFYVLMWKQVTQSYWKSYPSHAMGIAGLQLKVVESTTGPGEELRNALWHTGDTPGQVRTLWSDPTSQGWRDHSAYRWRLNHRPSTGEIRVVMYRGKDLLVDSGRIVDKTYAGGRMGMFIFSQEMVFYSDMEYKCNDAPIEY